MLVLANVHPPVLHRQGDDGQTDPNEDDDEDSSNVVDGDTTTIIICLLTHLAKVTLKLSVLHYFLLLTVTSVGIEKGWMRD